MYFGSTSKTILSVYSDLVKMATEKGYTNIFIPFAGNFSIEYSLLSSYQNINIISNEISLYSVTLGKYLSEQEIDYSISPEILQQVPALSELKDNLDKAAAIIFLQEYCPIYEKSKKTAYYANLLTHANNRIDKYFTELKAKLERFKEPFKKSNFAFRPMDAKKTLDENIENSIILFDPPYFKGDYEAMFKALAKHVTFREIPYTEFDVDVVKSYIDKFQEANNLVIYRSLTPKIENLSCVYANIENNYYMTGKHYVHTNISKIPRYEKQKGFSYTVAKLPIASHGFTVPKPKNAKIHFVKTKMSDINYLRSMWVKKAFMTSGGTGYLITLNGMVIGCCVVDSGMTFSTKQIRIFSDPCSPYTKYKRLSKLIIQLMATTEFITMYNNETLWEHNTLNTIAYSDNPISMKYRGIFELTERKDNDANDYKYKLTYRAKKILPTYKEAYLQWFNKNATVTSE